MSCDSDSFMPRCRYLERNQRAVRGAYVFIHTLVVLHSDLAPKQYAIPSGTLVAGSNTITINIVSGSSGDDFLSPNVVYDSIELY